MKLLIEIPDNVYIACNEYKDSTFIGILQRIIYTAVSNGTPLPKGHGDLIDRDECLKLKMTDLYDKDGVTMYAVPTGNILRIKPVIEADNERIAELEGRTCKDCASNDICCVTHTDDCPACLDFRTYTKAELEGKHKENKE